MTEKSELLIVLQEAAASLPVNADEVLGLLELDCCRCDSICKVQSKLDYLRSLLNDHVTFKSIYRYAYDFARVSLTRPTCQTPIIQTKQKQLVNQPSTSHWNNNGGGDGGINVFIYYWLI